MWVVKLVSTLGKGSEKKGSRREIGQSSLGLGSLSPDSDTAKTHEDVEHEASGNDHGL